MNTIQDRHDFRAFLEADRVALGRERNLRALVLDDVWRFQRALRRYEYHLNCGHRLRCIGAWAAWRRHSRRLGFTIPPNTFGPGLSIAHYGTIVVNSGARIGSNCRLHVGVNIGTAAGANNAAPTVGENVYIGPGAKLFGLITVGKGAVIGANAVVNRDVPAGVTVGGVPARIISENSSNGLLVANDAQA